MSDTIEKPGIINLYCHSCESYYCVVLSDSEVAFLGEEKDANFRSFFVSFVNSVAKSEKLSRQIFFERGVQSQINHTKDSKNVIWYLLA